MFAARRLFMTGSPPRPTFSGISPSAGGAGTGVTISGTNFVVGSTTVTIGGVSATNVAVAANGLSLTCNTPSLGSRTTYSVVITTPAGSVTATNVWTNLFPPTAPTSASPSIIGPGTTVTVSGGSNYYSPVTMQFWYQATGGYDQKNAASTTLINSGSVSGVVPTGTMSPASHLETVNISVITNDGNSGPYGGATCYFALPPTFSSVSPTTGLAGTSLTISGSRFISGGTSVSIGGTAVSVSVTDANTLTCTAPANTTGAKDIVISTVGGSATGSGAFTYLAVPIISSVNDSRGGNGAKTGSTITLSGSNFTGASVTFNGAAMSASVSATSISFTVPAPISPGYIYQDGPVSIVVTTANGSASTSVYGWIERTAGAVTTYITRYDAVGSGTYSIPGWANSVDCIAIGGGQGGGGGTTTQNGVGGGAGVWSSVSLVRSSNWAVTSLSYTVGAAGLKGPINTNRTGGGVGGTSIAGSASGAGGSVHNPNGTVFGLAPGNNVYNGISYTGGSGTTPPGVGGGGGGFPSGVAADGTIGRVWFRPIP